MNQDIKKDERVNSPAVEEASLLIQRTTDSDSTMRACTVPEEQRPLDNWQDQERHPRKNIYEVGPPKVRRSKSPLPLKMIDFSA